MNPKQNGLGIIILAAGKGTRMQSDLAKVLHPLSGQPLLQHVIDTSTQLQPTKCVVVVGHQAEQVKARFSSNPLISFAYQPKMLGTGDAVKVCRDQFEGFEGPILVLYGDVPLTKLCTLRALLHQHEQEKNTLTLLTTVLDDPTGYGRIVSQGNQVMKIVEHKDATEAEKRICEINSGIGVYDGRFLMEGVKQLKPSNAQQEYYLTDLVSMARMQGLRVQKMKIENVYEVMGINDKKQLEEMEKFMKAGF